MAKISIKEGTIDEALTVQNRIPEFASSYDKEEYLKRLINKEHLILIALAEDKPVGFKVGYALDKTVFYSWMGGVLPAYRKMNVAKHLAIHQEQWAKQNGFQTVRFKTRNYLKPMLIFGLRNGFHIVDVIKKEHPQHNRIILEKAFND